MGSPGTGKTSFILAVAAELKLSVCLMNLTGNMDDNQLMGAMENAPKNTILLLEDVDSIFIERTSVNESKGRKISFSGLLNAIDGVRTQEGRILFMSTNHIEKLDPALLRPGRADVHVKLDYASKEQIRRMWMRFYPDEKEGMVEGFLKVVPEKKVSMAKLQGHFLRFIDIIIVSNYLNFCRNKSDPKNALENAHRLTESIDFSSEMSIASWLFHLNLEEFSEGFLRENISTVEDLKGISEKNLTTFGISKSGDKKRILNMINGEDSAKKAFELMSHQSIRAFLGILIKDPKEVESIVKMVPEGYVTEFHLRDVFEKDLNKELEQRAKEMMEKVRTFYSGQKLKKRREKEKIPKRKPRGDVK